MPLTAMRSLLFVPANRERFVAKLAQVRPDAVILDLEDSVPPAEKAVARVHARAALARLADTSLVRLVRVNPLSSSLAVEDIRAVVGPELHGIVLPKVQRVEELREANMVLAQAEVRAGLELGRTRLLPILETVHAVLHAEEMAAAGPRVLAVAFGAEDYILELGGVRTPQGLEVLYARSHVVAAARLAGVGAIDTPWTHIADLDGLRSDARFARQLGFSGKLCVHPNHVEPIHRAFAPTAEEVARARRVVEAAEHAARQGHGSVALDGQMLDAPIVARARQVLRRSQPPDASAPEPGLTPESGEPATDG